MTVQKPRAGRPPLPQPLQKCHRIAVYLSTENYNIITTEAARSGVKLSHYIFQKLQEAGIPLQVQRV